MSSANKYLIIGKGMIGNAITKYLQDKGEQVDQIGYALEHLDKIQDSIIINCIGYNGGISFNKKYPYDIFFKNTKDSLVIMDYCIDFGLRPKKFVNFVASCAYPTLSPLPFREETFLDGPPHLSVACHAYAKRNIFLASRWAKEQYKLNTLCICPTTVYGNGDRFDPERGKVIPSIASKIINARNNNEKEITLLGTGNAFREFIYVEDLVKLVIEAANRFDGELINFSSGEQIKVKELAQLIKNNIKDAENIEIKFDGNTSKDGQLLKPLAIYKQSYLVPFFQFTPLEEGLKKTLSNL